MAPLLLVIISKYMEFQVNKNICITPVYLFFICPVLETNFNACLITLHLTKNFKQFKHVPTMEIIP